MNPHNPLESLHDQPFIQHTITTLLRRNQTQAAMDLAFLFIQNQQSDCLVEVDHVIYPLRSFDGKDSTSPALSKDRRLVEPINIPVIWGPKTAFFVCADFVLHAYQTVQRIKSEDFHVESNTAYIYYLLQCTHNFDLFSRDQYPPDLPSGLDPARMNFKLRILESFFEENLIDTDPTIRDLREINEFIKDILFIIAKEKKERSLWDLSDKELKIHPKNKRYKTKILCIDENVEKEMEWQKQTLLRYFLNQSPLLSDAPPSLTYDESKSLF